MTIKPHSHRMASRPRGRSAFTIIELLISIAIIFVLITSAVVALKGAKKAANRTDTSNSIRQMIQAYSGYTNEHDGRLLPGYIEPGMLGTAPDKLNIKAELPQGYKLSPLDTASYVWRLAPYLDNAWDTYMIDYRSVELGSMFTTDYGNGDGSGCYGPGSASSTQIGIATAPAIGLNSIYVGGDSFHGTGNTPDRSPWSAGNPNIPNPDRISVVRIAEVKSPAELIVFGPTKRIYPASIPALPNPLATAETLGYVELRPPVLPSDDDPLICNLVQYIADPNNILTPSAAWTSGAGGVMYDRAGVDQVPLAHMDGSVTTHLTAEFLAPPSGPGFQSQINSMMRSWMGDAYKLKP